MPCRRAGWRRGARTLVVLSCLVAGAHHVQAQETDPAAGARVRLGPLALTPVVSVTNAGFDSNILNESENPRSDVTLTVIPSLQSWLRFGRARLAIGSVSDFSLYRDSSDQSSAGTRTTGRLDVPFGRLSPFVAASYLSSRERPNLEIDVRPRRVEKGVEVGAEARVTAKTLATVVFQRSTVAYAEDAVFRDAPLDQALNRSSSSTTLGVRYKATPLTTILFDADFQRGRFEFSPDRDTDTWRIGPSLLFSAGALITGRASVGLRNFEIADPNVPGYTGLVAAIDVGYTLRGATRFSVRVDRDVAYSSEILAPYYLQTGAGFSVTHRFADRFDASASASRDVLTYRMDLALPQNAPPATVAVTPGSGPDRVLGIGGSVGYRLRPSTRLGFNVESSRRSSGRTLREFNRLRSFASVTHAF